MIVTSLHHKEIKEERFWSSAAFSFRHAMDQVDRPQVRAEFGVHVQGHSGRDGTKTIPQDNLHRVLCL